MMQLTGYGRRVLISVLLTFLIKTTKAQVPSLGKCPDYPVVEDFKPEEYAGRWYEIETYFAFGEFGAKCVTTKYIDYGEGKMGFLQNQILESTGSEESISGTATLLCRKGGEAKLKLTYSSLPWEKEEWILKTDYKHFALVWSCTDFWGIFNFQMLKFLARTSDPESEVNDEVTKHLNYLGINAELLRLTDQWNCPS